MRPLGATRPHLVELVLQDTRLQTQLSKAVFFDRLDHPIHLGIVRRGEVGEVDVWGDEIVTQHVGIEVAEDFLCIPTDRAKLI